VSITRSPELIAALLAILKCGGVYVPVDSSWPDERLHWIFKETQCGHLITDETENLSARFPKPYVLPATAEPCAPNPDVTTQPDDIAYVNFTSGSTGQPKGVPIRHRSIARLVFNSRYARLDERTTLIQLAPVSFDAATFEIWGALLHGGTCVLYPAKRVRLSELKRTLDTHRVTVIFLTTALFNTVVDEGPATLDGVETILTGGEAHSMRHIREAVARYGPDKVVNVYGPTECTTFATYFPLSLDVLPDGMLDLPIGFPIQNTRLYLVDEGELCPPGRVGEVCLAGPGLSPGYLGMQEVTRERFVDCEIDGIRERLYRTGDRGYFLADGNLVFQGRLDDQVKINGYRIELGEIAHHLDRHPQVRLSYVTVGESSIGEKVLTAFVVPQSHRCAIADITDYLRIHLPGYMIPTKIHLRDSLPLSATGKVDREALLKSTEPTGPSEPTQGRS
jgi:amino acid adenylation domain-containing protein